MFTLDKKVFDDNLKIEDGIVYVNTDHIDFGCSYSELDDVITQLRDMMGEYVTQHYPQANVTFKDGLTVGKIVSYFYRQGKHQSLKAPKVGEELVPESNNLFRGNSIAEELDFVDNEYRTLNKDYIILNSTAHGNDDMYSQPSVLVWRKSPYFIDEDGCLHTIVVICNSSDKTIAMIKMTPYKAEQI